MITYNYFIYKWLIYGAKCLNLWNKQSHDGSAKLMVHLMVNLVFSLKAVKLIFSDIYIICYMTSYRIYNICHRPITYLHEIKHKSNSQTWDSHYFDTRYYVQFPQSSAYKIYTWTVCSQHFLSKGTKTFMHC